METIHLKDEFIKLGQALKLAGLVESGVEYIPIRGMPFPMLLK